MATRKRSDRGLAELYASCRVRYPLPRVSARASDVRVPFNRASVVGRELEHVAAVARSGALAGDHEFTGRCQQMLESALGARHALLTTSCTHALEMAALLLDLGPDDEVIVPSFTFVSTCLLYTSDAADE